MVVQNAELGTASIKSGGNLREVAHLKRASAPGTPAGHVTVEQPSEGTAGDTWDAAPGSGPTAQASPGSADADASGSQPMDEDNDGCTTLGET